MSGCCSSAALMGEPPLVPTIHNHSDIVTNSRFYRWWSNITKDPSCIDTCFDVKSVVVGQMTSAALLNLQHSFIHHSVPSNPRRNKHSVQNPLGIGIGTFTKRVRIQKSLQQAGISQHILILINSSIQARQITGYFIKGTRKVISPISPARLYRLPSSTAALRQRTRVHLFLQLLNQCPGY
ncbi:hypothetical protein AVEN_117183-1 [Araneus ventricosus]|uniref:Uncharacterized protein n=1 Tax=Araneus ventricosus TaxID=182803 RepID=A0A4Y2AZ09_ARAVE|nr:hypothetical protein AVEN_117183-1 [Araneus ventricosus]